GVNPPHIRPLMRFEDLPCLLSVAGAETCTGESFPVHRRVVEETSLRVHRNCEGARELLGQVERREAASGHAEEGQVLPAQPVVDLTDDLRQYDRQVETVGAQIPGKTKIL